MNSIRPFLSSESVREEKGNSTAARYILRTGTGSAQARAGIDAMRACLPAGEYRSSLHVQYHPRVGGRVHTMSPCTSGWCPCHDCARTHTHTHSHSNIADEQTRYNMCFAAQGAMRTSHAGTVPLAPSLPVAPGRPWRPHHPCIFPSSRRAWAAGQTGLSLPPIMGNIGSAYSGGPTGQSHIPGRYFAWPLFASCLCADGPDRLSSASLLRLRKSPPPPDVV